ncbi:MAG: metallophosphoesterase, partial [Chloroflexota bacterium]
MDDIQISQLAFEIPLLPQAFNGYRIVQISDLHVGTWLGFDQLNDIVSLVNKQFPDLIVITGDIIPYFNAHLIHKLIEPLRNLSARNGVLCVRGNHDCWVQSKKFHETMRKSNVIELNNKVHTISRNGSSIQVAGIDDGYYKLNRLNTILPLLSPEIPAILLCHEPDLADIYAASKKFSLQLSGHTHGGQINLPGVRSFWLPRLGRKYPSGHYHVNGMNLYTNRGIGTSSLTFRYRCPPEIAVITLVA